MEERNAPLLSVIVPVYNAEKYLARCLDSILCQTYTNLEVICINDGSTDNSEIILKEYEKKDCRLQCYSQGNVGVGKTRNHGLSVFRGKYVTFVDSDDYISPIMYETMLSEIQRTGADMCICQWKSATSHPTEHSGSSYYGIHKSLDFFKKNYLESEYINMAVGSLWNKVYRKGIICDARAEFKYSEDQEINDQVYSKDCKVVVIPEPFYFYFNNPTSINHKPWPGDTIQFLDVLNKRCNVYQDTDIIRDTEILYCNMYVEYRMRAKAIDVDLPEKYYTYFKQMCFRLIPKRCGVKFYTRMFIFLLSPSLYIAIVKNKTKR